MELERDLERNEIMDDVSDELDETTRGERPRRRLRSQSGIDPQKKSLILGAAGAILLIILLVVFFGGGGKDENAAKELDAVKSRLDGMEKRLARVEGIEQKISSSESQIKGLQASVNRLENLSRGMKDQIEKLAQPPAPPKPQAQPVAPQKKPAAAEKRLHEVRRGETIFNIAKKYGITPDELRRMNHLSKNDPIQLGQRLIIDTGK
jgi:LysM repeat protein